MINKKTPIEEAVEMVKIYGNHRYEEGREQGWRDVETRVKNTGECPIAAYHCPKRNQCDDCEELIALKGELVKARKEHEECIKNGIRKGYAKHVTKDILGISDEEYESWKKQIELNETDKNPFYISDKCCRTCVHSVNYEDEAYCHHYDLYVKQNDYCDDWQNGEFKVNGDQND